MSPETKKAYCDLRALLEPTLRAPGSKLTESDIEIFLVRLERYFDDFYQSFARLYRQHPAFQSRLEAIGQLLVESYAGRSGELRRLDLEREITPDWFQRETMIGWICYVDLFAGNLQGVKEQVDYLRELGVNYVHLMPLLKPRPGQNDGGYAVEDYREVNPQLGNMEDLEELSATLRSNGMSLCIDLVVNHTAKEHEWAQRARAGEQEYLDYYFTFDNRTVPDQYEKTLREVFPEFAPGNFTYYPEMAGTGKWVWTTFNEFQWDLNYTNPAVFQGMLGYMLYLANRGVDVLRLDAVPFMWKRMGTDCENQPEVHDLLQAFRALVRIVSPSVIFKAEAIVPPYQLVNYLGLGRHTGKECEIAYNNSLMVLIWSALASRKSNLITYSLQHMPQAPVGTTWVTYVRLHDDIGWAITDENAGAVGESGFFHRQFLNQFYSGVFPGSFAHGEIFQFNPRTLDGRMSGTTASLAGLESALRSGDDHAIELAIRRIALLYSVIFSYGGIPLLYMGDEIGLLNDSTYKKDPVKAADNRWMHRPFMDWEKAAKRHDPQTVPGRIYQKMLQLVTARKRAHWLHAAAPVEALWCGNEHVFAYIRRHPTGNLLALCNFTEATQWINTEVIWNNGLHGVIRDELQPDRSPVPLEYNQIKLEPYQAVWLVGD
ncbi:MAG TPA: alpha-amylase family protein [Chloroflexia bacterium]|nr:alpha-amylase family protein [Chloroflexia bacterium]